MAKKKLPEPTTQTRWEIRKKVLRKVSTYKSLHGLGSLEVAANILLEKATADIVLPD